MSEGTTTMSKEPAAASERQTPSTPPKPPGRKFFRWGFLSASLVILGLIVLGEAIGRQSERAQVMLSDTDSLGAKEWASLGVQGLFLLCSLGLALLQWRSVRNFLLHIKVGTSLVAITTAGVMAGVLVPQIDGFEDPEMRVTEQNYEEQYQAFAYAESYFLYHLTHLYGIGGPDEEAKQPPGGWAPLEAKLENFGRKYGREEQKNREKEMHAAFANRAKMPYITGGTVVEDGKQVYVQGFVRDNEGFLRGFFDVSTALNLNRAYKSYWFKTLMILLAISVA